MNYKRLLATIAFAAMPAIAQAHTGHHADGLSAGFSHPFGGLDHILAMVAVGFWAATLEGKARFIVPAAFVVVMAFGALLGIYGIELPLVEAGIAASVALLGLLVAFEVKVPIAAAAAIVGVCALFHGHAHGLELPTMADAGGYIAGFLAATIILHVAGIALAAVRFGGAARMAARIAGAVVAVTGAALLAG